MVWNSLRPFVAYAHISVLRTVIADFITIFIISIIIIIIIIIISLSLCHGTVSRLSLICFKSFISKYSL